MEAAANLLFMDSALSLGLLITISVLTCAGMIVVSIFKPKVQIYRFSLDTYWIIALCGALSLLLLGLASPQVVGAGLIADTSINPLKILVLFLSMTFLSLVLDELGFFHYLAEKTVKFAGKSQIKLFFAFYVIISLLTVFTSNDIIILTFTPFICYFAKYAGINPIPYLVLEFVAANTWSMVFIIGNPTNIFLASSFGITFMDYLSVMALPAIVGSLVALLLLWLLFHKQIFAPLQPMQTTISLRNKPGVIIGLIHLIVCVVFLAISSYIGIEMWLVSLVCVCSLGVCSLILSLIQKHRPKELGMAVRRIPWQFIPFILAMFTIVLSLASAQVTDAIADLLNYAGPVWTYGISSFLASNIVNNIPMSVLFSFVLESAPAASLTAGIYASIIGSNVGAFLTPIGALAGLMWMNIIKNQGIRYSFGKFVKYGVLVAVPSLIATLTMLFIILSC